MPRSPRRGAAAVLALAVSSGAVLAACGSSATPDAASLSAKALVAQALQNAKVAGWVHEVLVATGKGHSLSMNNDVGTTSGRQIILSDGSHSSTLVLNNVAYIKGDERAVVHYFQIPTKHPQALAGQWILIHSTDPGYATVSSAVTLASDFRQVSIAGPLTKGPVTTVAGVKVIPVHGHLNGPSGTKIPATIYVTSSGTILPIQFHAAMGKLSETSTWTHWGRTVTLVAPASTIPITQILG